MNLTNKMSKYFAFSLSLCIGLYAPFSLADENRRGGQIEGMIGGSGCIPGKAPCRQDQDVLHGGTKPSFGTGVSLGIRPVRWFLIGALYRFGLFNPAYTITDNAGYRYGAQHTVALMLRPILPIWRFDLGLNLAPGYSRQVFRLDQGRDRDYSQGFAFLVGPTIDVFVTDKFFLGAEVDFILNSQKKICAQRDSNTVCSEVQNNSITPTHQVLFGLHLGGTFL